MADSRSVAQDACFWCDITGAGVSLYARHERPICKKGLSLVGFPGKLSALTGAKCAWSGNPPRQGAWHDSNEVWRQFGG